MKIEGSTPGTQRARTNQVSQNRNAAWPKQIKMWFALDYREPRTADGLWTVWDLVQPSSFTAICTREHPTPSAKTQKLLAFPNSRAKALAFPEKSAYCAPCLVYANRSKARPATPRLQSYTRFGLKQKTHAPAPESSENWSFTSRASPKSHNLTTREWRPRIRLAVLRSRWKMW